MYNAVFFNKDVSDITATYMTALNRQPLISSSQTMPLVTWKISRQVIAHRWQLLIYRLVAKN